MENERRRILVAIDGSNNSKRAVTEAKKYGECVAGDITLLTVKKPMSTTYYGNIELSKVDSENILSAKQDILNDALKEFADYPYEVSTKLRKGNAADEILEEADEGAYDLIVMGSRGLGAFSRTILGSVSNKVLNHTNTHVLTIR